MDNKKILELLEKINLLERKQKVFYQEINLIKNEIIDLKNNLNNTTETSINQTIETNHTIQNSDFDNKSFIDYTKKQTKNREIKAPKIKLDFEQFIGENLISKIGIIITIIGVAIGTKYSIEHNLINPITRIILGYITGFILLAVGIKLKNKYLNYSAVLVSGAMSIMYFLTYSAYGFYELIPLELAFVLMFVFTAFTIISSLNYNKPIIAHLGLVGAYAVPFFLSNGTGQVAILFTYMTIINTGILIIAFKKYWKSLYYSSYILTWIIFLSWYSTSYNQELHFNTSLIYSLIFFIIFYISFLAYKLIKREKFEFIDISMILTNSFIFYGIGYSILCSNLLTEDYLGLYTLINAIIHFVIVTIIYKQKLADQHLFYLSSGLVLTFITIAIPIQLDGNWVTILWGAESVILFWIGRSKNNPIYEKISYPLIIISFFSLLHDYSEYYFSFYGDSEMYISPIFNSIFLTSFILIIAYIIINKINSNKEFENTLKISTLYKIMSFIIPALLILSIYLAFRMEIISYFRQILQNTSIKIIEEGNQYPSIYRNYDLKEFRTIWNINYSILYISILSFLNFKILRNDILSKICFYLNIAVIFAFLTQGLYAISELRESYINQDLAQYYNRDYMHILIRYISYLFISTSLISIYKFIKSSNNNLFNHKYFDFIFFGSILWILSSELINILDLFEFSDSYKLGLSILWGVYSLILIIYGIIKTKQHLRIAAISLFAITLIKLFAYDISHLNTISKTIVFVSLGILLLIISFLYNKFKNKISLD